MKKPHKIRLDQELVRRGLAESIKEATAQIIAGKVIADDQRLDKPGALITEDSIIRLKQTGRFVSRGGDKLFGALEDFALLDAINGTTVLDVGASTGGFTDCVLQLGASKVLAVDVGTNQLAWEIRSNPKVTCFEKTDIREFQPPKDAKVDWIVADLSFTPLVKMIGPLINAAPNARMILLVKPQFELPREEIPDGGVVLKESDRKRALEGVKSQIIAHGRVIISSAESKIDGKSGNKEIFILTD